MKTTQELDAMMNKNLDTMFTYLDAVNKEDSIKDNGDTNRILKLIADSSNEK